MMIRLSKRFNDFIEKSLSLDWHETIGPLEISEDDLFNRNIGKRSENLFMGYFSVNGLKIILDRYKISSKLAKKGFTNLKVEINTTDPYKHKFILKNTTGEAEEKLIELVLRRDYITVDMPFNTPLNGRKLEALVVEWLKMQNPRTGFTRGKSRLPGQDYPGLGIGSEALELLVLAAHRLGLHAIINIPDHYHNAFLYSKIFNYEKPYDQAKLAAIMRDTKKYDVSEVAWAIEEKALLDVNGLKPVDWFVAKQVFPLYKEWVYLYKSNRYRYEVYKEMKKFKFKIDKNWINRRKYL
ncbi:MAG: hypothetical protein KDF60_12940 [Calditrichaeota bacterium]|nr:hypothetical protein [Calditrichota bacterium]